MTSILAVETPEVVGGVLIAAVGGLLGWLATLVTNRASNKSQFDYRFRLEKEYDRYCDLWAKLFKLRRSVGSLVDSLGGGRHVSHESELNQTFNEYQQAVRNSEPFVRESVYEPARAILKHSLRIISNSDRMQDLEKLGNPDNTADEQIKLHKESDAQMEEIERLFSEVSQAIKRRFVP